MTERPDVEKQPRRDLWHIPRERLLEYVMHLAIKGNWPMGKAVLAQSRALVC